MGKLLDKLRRVQAGGRPSCTMIVPAAGRSARVGAGDKLKLELFYIEYYSVWLDWKLMLLTLKILFTPDSTEGVDEKQVTAMKKQVQEEEK